MLKAILVSLSMVVPVLAFPACAADVYKLEPTHASVIFTYGHFGLSHPTGKIMGASGTVTLDTAAPANSSVDVTLDLNSLVTGLPDFDAQLKGPDYFDVARFPAATFKSTSVQVTSPGGDTAPATAIVTGDLTLHGVTKSVALNVTYNKKAFNPALFKTGVGFSATAHLSRSDFGLGKFEPFVEDGIDLDIEAEAYP